MPVHDYGEKLLGTIAVGVELDDFYLLNLSLEHSVSIFLKSPNLKATSSHFREKVKGWDPLTFSNQFAEITIYQDNHEKCLTIAI